MWAIHWLAGAAMAGGVGGPAQAQVSDMPQALSAPVAAVALKIEPQVGPIELAIEAPLLETPAVEAAATPFGTAVVDAADLSEMSGGQAVVVSISNHDLDAINHGNSITANTVGSGTVELGSGAFSGFNGIGNFVINTGHNNNLQGSLSVNVVLAQ